MLDISRITSALAPFAGTRTYAEPPQAPAPSGRPGAWTRAGEATTPLQLARLLTRAPWLARAPRGDGHVVIDIPGWGAPESSGAPVRAYLRWLGYDARPWGFGVNRGDPERDAERLAARIVELSGEVAGPFSLVGWSLGGVIAREVARAIPARVRRVITYGTPVVGGPTHTVGANSWSAAERERITSEIERVDASDPIRPPIAAIFSKRDGVVDWRACIDRSSLDVEHVEVTSTHLGLGIDPDVWTVIAERLAIAPRAAAR